MALARRTSGHTASPSASSAAAATMTASSSPQSSARPPRLVAPCRACSSDLLAVVVVLVCFSCVALCLHYAARVLLRCLDDRRRAGREAQAPKPPSESDAGGGSGTSSPVVASVWAEAECAICLSELVELEGDERVRVLPACGHGFHAACVEACMARHARILPHLPLAVPLPVPAVADDESAVAMPDGAAGYDTYKKRRQLSMVFVSL